MSDSELETQREAGGECQRARAETERQGVSDRQREAERDADREAVRVIIDVCGRGLVCVVVAWCVWWWLGV